MSKKIDSKAAALAAAQGSGAVFEALADDVQPVAEPRRDDAQPVFTAQAEPAAPTHDKSEDDTTMNAQTNNAQAFSPAFDVAAEKVRSMFTGAGANGFDGKDVMERTQKLAQEAAELAKSNLEAMAASARIAAQNAGALTQDIAAVSRKSFEEASGAVKGFAEAKSPTELMRLQGEFAKTYFETMMAEGARMSETFVKLAGEALGPVQSQMAANVEKAKSIVK